MQYCSGITIFMFSVADSDCILHKLCVFERVCVGFERLQSACPGFASAFACWLWACVDDVECADQSYVVRVSISIFNLFIKHDRSLHKLVRQGTNKNKINVLLLLLLILEQVNKRHRSSNIFTKRTEYESQGWVWRGHISYVSLSMAIFLSNAFTIFIN